MFGKKPEYSSLRFCKTATELPYSTLVRFRPLTIALARVETEHTIPSRGGELAPRAYGVLHGSSTFFDGSAEPMLPVEMSFYRSVSGDRFATGHVSEHFGYSDQFQVLRISVRDETGSTFAAVQSAITNACLSKERFCHVRLFKDDFKVDRSSVDFRVRHAEDQAFLQKVDAGEEDFPELVFDGLAFENNLCSHGPEWAWSWPAFEQGGARFYDKGTAKWRRSRRKVDLK